MWLRGQPELQETLSQNKQASQQQRAKTNKQEEKIKKSPLLTSEMHKIDIFWSHFKHPLCLPPHPPLSCFSEVFYQLFSHSGNTVLVEGISLHASLPTKKVCKRKKKKEQQKEQTIASPTTLSLIGLVGDLQYAFPAGVFP